MQNKRVTSLVTGVRPVWEVRPMSAICGFKFTADPIDDEPPIRALVP